MANTKEDPHLMMVMRKKTGNRFNSFSEDLGKTKPKLKPKKAPKSQ